MVKEDFKGSSANAAFAVFDGHGGQQAADHCQTNMVDALERQISLQSNVLQGIKKGKISFKSNELYSFGMIKLFLTYFRQNCALS